MERKRGRRSTFDQAKAEQILEHILDGQSMRSACGAAGVAAATFMGWVADDRGGLFQRYRRTKVVGAMAVLEEIMEIADDASADVIDGRPNTDKIRRDAERVHVRQWLFDRLMPQQPTAAPIVLKFQPE